MSCNMNTDQVFGRSGTALRKPFCPEGQPPVAEPQQDQGPDRGLHCSPGRGLVVDRTCSMAGGAQCSEVGRSKQSRLA